MKRFVVVVISVLIIFVFIALNYLLWDRESLVSLRESNQASIDALGRINMNLNEEKNRLEQQIADLVNQIKIQDDRIKSMENDIRHQQAVIEDKTRFILDLKEHINPQPVFSITTDWITALAEKSYPAAFIKSGSSCRFWGNVWTLRIFTDFFDKNVLHIQLAEHEEGHTIMEAIASETPDWEIKVIARVFVELADESNQEFLQQGENILHFTYTFNERLEQWMIVSVAGEPTASDEMSPDANDSSNNGIE